MTARSEIRCVTPRCVAVIAEYGENYHMVYDRDFYSQCEYCGAKLIDGKWVSACRTCKADVKPGELVGLFVPHSCAACLDKERQAQKQRGAVCGRCRSAYVDCCC